jgi:hypothetical protein
MMPDALKALVEGDRIRWLDASETLFPPGQPVEALIVPAHDRDIESSALERGERRVAALRKLMGLQAFSSIADPGAWQRETRDDRELPGRE